MSELKWIPIVSDIYSTTNYFQYQNESFEHLFTVDFDDDRPIKLVRIDIQDRFYLKQFSLIYLETGETIEGNTFGDKFVFRFAWAPKKGKYKIISQGGKYLYSVFMLESTMKLTCEPICRAQSPFNILVSCPIKDKSLYKQVLYRKAGAAEWMAAELSVAKVPIEVDPTSAYEVKLKFVMPDMFETEYSPTIITTAHQSWTNEFEPDPAFVNTTLLFKIQMRVWLSNIAITLKYKPTLDPDNCWIYDTKNPSTADEKYKDPRALIWSLEDQLYDKSIVQDLTINWQFVIRNIKTNQETESTVKKLDLQKRHKIMRGETITGTHLLQFHQGYKDLYLCRDGQFWFSQHKRRVVDNAMTREIDWINFNGNFTLERKNPEDTKCVITLIPKFKKLENNTQLDRLSMTLLPELVKLILSFVFGPSNTEKLKHVVSLNLVCKHWFNIFADGMLQLNGGLMDNYRVKRRGFDANPLNIVSWTTFVYSSK